MRRENGITVLRVYGMLIVAAVCAGCDRDPTEDDPLTEVNRPRPTNIVADPLYEPLTKTNYPDRPK
jgi:hypothetical protein